MRKAFTILLMLTAWVVSGQSVELRDGLYFKNGKLYKGIIKETDSSGKVVASLSINKGRLQGETFMYHDNGAVKELRDYRKGLKHGVWYSYDEKGHKTGTAHYKKDLKNGVWLIWDENGQLRYYMKYKRGEKTGTWIMYDEKGTIVNEKKF